MSQPHLEGGNSQHTLKDNFFCKSLLKRSKDYLHNPINKRVKAIVKRDHFSYHINQASTSQNTQKIK